MTSWRASPEVDFTVVQVSVQGTNRQPPSGPNLLSECLNPKHSIV